jgi:hypothetical protein
MEPGVFFNKYKKALWRALAFTSYTNEELGFHSENWVSLPGPAQWWEGVDIDAAGFELVKDPDQVQEMLDLMKQEEPITKEV